VVDITTSITSQSSRIYDPDHVVSHKIELSRDLILTLAIAPLGTAAANHQQLLKVSAVMDSGDHDATLSSSSSILSRLSSLTHSVRHRSDNIILDSTAATNDTNSTRLHRDRRLRESIAMSAPLGFVSSGYFMGVIFMVSQTHSCCHD
jgi:hypothetical protein